MHRAADDEGQPDKNTEHHDPCRRVPLSDLLGQRILTAPQIDDKKAENKEEDPKGGVKKTRRHPRQKADVRRFPIGRKDDRPQDFPAEALAR